MITLAYCENGTNILLDVPKVAFENGKDTYHFTMTFYDDTGYFRITATVPYSGQYVPVGKIFPSALRCYDDAYAQARIRGSIYVADIRGSGNISGEISYTTTYTSYNYNIGLRDAQIIPSLNSSEIMNCKVVISADFPLFMENRTETQETSSADTAYYYSYDTPNYNTYASEIALGNYEHIGNALNYYSVVNEIPDNKVYTIRCMLKKNGSVVSGTNKAYDFRIQPDARIWLVYTNRVSGDGSPNFILHLNMSPWLQKNAYAPDNTYAETSVLDTDYWWGNWTDYDNGDSYTGVASTNIPIFDSDEKGDAYGRGEIGIDEALNGGDTSFSRSTIGDDLSASDIPTVNLAVSGCGSYIYALSSSDLKDVMSNYVYTTDATLQNNIQDGLWLWGNNPADFIIDLYYIPFAITNFYDTITANLKFGTYQIPDTSYSAVKEANGDRITLFNTSFEGIYGDWRDFTQFDYELFLPFKGFVTLDVYKILNRTVRCEMMFDITTHNIRYYLFADDVIIERYDASVGVNMPIMASDMVNKAKAEHNATLGAVKSGANAIGGIIGNGAKVLAGDVVGGVSGLVQTGTNAVIDGIKTYDTFASHETQSVQGDFSSSMNIYDITYAYIKITERGLIIPDKLHTLYNYPSYYMGKASALSGYCEISDIRLNGFTGTKDEAIALKNDLKEGVIL